MDDRFSSLKSNCVSYKKSWHLHSRLDCDQELTSLLSSQANKSSFSTSSCRIVWMMIAAIAPLSTRWSKCYDHLVLVVPPPVPNDHLHGDCVGLTPAPSSDTSRACQCFRVMWVMFPTKVLGTSLSTDVEPMFKLKTQYSQITVCSLGNE